MNVSLESLNRPMVLLGGGVLLLAGVGLYALGFFGAAPEVVPQRFAGPHVAPPAGQSWEDVAPEALPQVAAGEAAFPAGSSNEPVATSVPVAAARPASESPGALPPETAAARSPSAVGAGIAATGRRLDPAPRRADGQRAAAAPARPLEAADEEPAAGSPPVTAGEEDKADEPEEKPAPRKRSSGLTADELLEAFATDPATAVKKHLNKLVEVTGTVDQISRDEGVVEVYLVGEEQDGWIVCGGFKSAQAVAKLASGQEVTIRGKCLGTRTGSNVTLDQCTVKRK